MHKCVIIGAGPAGLTAAIYLAKDGYEPLVMKGPEPSGHLVATTDLDDYPGFPQGILGPELLTNMYRQAEWFGAKIVTGHVGKVDLSGRPFGLFTGRGDRIDAETLIVATGTSPLYMGIPGEKESIGRGVSSCAPCNGFFYENKKVIVVGDGDFALEEALFLTRFAAEVTVVSRSRQFRGSPHLLERAQKNGKIGWALNRTPLEVATSSKGVTGLRVRNGGSGFEELIGCDGIFVAIGYSPNTGFLEGQLQTDESGYLLTKERSTETSIPGVFVCGDVQDPQYSQIITAAGSGCMAALDCKSYLEHHQRAETELMFIP